MLKWVVWDKSEIKGGGKGLYVGRCERERVRTLYVVLVGHVHGVPAPPGRSEAFL